MIPGNWSFRLLCSLLLILSVPLSAFSQQRSLEASVCAQVPRIDGVFDDECWKGLPVADNFIVNNPTPGTPFPQRTEVRLVYGKDAIYVAFACFDTEPDSILRQLSGRDQQGNTDYAGITISCYRDGINGFGFFVTPNGEQYDVRMDNNGDDVSWNAVWYCKTQINDEGWFAEFRIPFAAIRFPDLPEQDWNINFERELRRIRHHAYWNEVNPLVPGVLTQMGRLTGIRNVRPPRRIFFFPYASTYYDTSEGSNGERVGDFRYSAGMDLKLGLSDAFTLDATLIPDFGQTISDQQILNLSAFEVQFADNRQFFTEGTELFSRAGIFYSRRIGFERPHRYYSASGELNEHEVITHNPGNDRVLNAIKISGRNSKKLGIGFFNAVTGPSFASVKDTLTGQTREVATSSLTNFNVFVLDQVLPNNSYLSLINTSVVRAGDDEDVNVTGTTFDLRNKKNSLSITGTGVMTNKFFPGKTSFDPGFSERISLNKINGNWNIALAHYAMSDTYDPTDLGFLTANNAFGFSLTNTYNIYKPFGRFNKAWNELFIKHNSLYNPRHFTDLLITYEGGITTRKFQTWGLNAETMPMKGYDFFEPRVWGRFFRTYSYTMGGIWFSSDYRKKVAIDASVYSTQYENDGRYKFSWRIAPRLRFSDHLFVTYVYSYQSHFNDLGYAFGWEDQNATQPLFGRRDVISHTNVLTVKYAFTPVMTINTRVRHYWGFSRYHEFFGLGDDGSLHPSDVTAANQNFNSFTIDMVYSWIFSPGSEISLVWKNAIVDFDDQVPATLLDDLDRTMGLPQTNSYSIKLIYFLDYRSLRALRRPDIGGKSDL